MSNPLTLVALSTQTITVELEKALKQHCLALGFSLTPLMESVQQQGYFSARWSMPAAPLPEARHALREIAAGHHADLAFLSSTYQPHAVRVLCMDMDSTLINIECIDEIAQYAGKKAAVAEITEATMRGEIKDFKDSLRRRVALLAGIPETVLESVYQERLQLNPGATELLSTANERGLHTLLVSGGFTFFTEKLKHTLRFKQAQANTLEIIDGKLTGKVLGEIVDGAAKAHYLQDACQRMQCQKIHSITMGDGSNDLLMMHGSGISVAYKAKSIVKEKADAVFDHVGLDAALLLMH
ncbi:phosphoserine phosphatase [Polynucleobacter meluiroseus]|uniref:Phosphoserine phosphatase n=1 Tax=Polynucleobacter meluiroseus TaxID=1938814 RepID=A0A240E2A4_9BURK|nr:phosphoserine phosphatase SerB [Polynucleobacter meluiroseus]SNX28606.1 phosphoserine phosphatase [Polynucleobacter meluiroseus]